MKLFVAVLVCCFCFSFSLAAQEQPEPSRTVPPNRTPSSARQSAPPSGTMPTPGMSPRALPTKPGKMITFEATIVDLDESLDAPSATSILELQKSGKFKYIARFELSSLEDQQAWVQFGEMTPRISGQTTVGRGFVGGGAPGIQAVPIYHDINVGTLAQIVGRVEDDGSIVAQVMIERSGLAGGPDGPLDSNTPIQPKAVERLVTNTTVRLTPGEPQIIGGRNVVSSGNMSNKTWIVITAKLGTLKVPSK